MPSDSRRRRKHSERSDSSERRHRKHKRRDRRERSRSRDRRRHRSRSRDRRRHRDRSREKKDKSRDRRERKKDKVKGRKVSEEMDERMLRQLEQQKQEVLVNRERKRKEQEEENKQQTTNIQSAGSEEGSSCEEDSDEGSRSNHPPAKDAAKSLKRRKKALKKYKQRKKLQLYDNKSDEDEEQLEARMQKSTIWKDTNIPEELKERLVRIESDPLCLVVANIPMSVTTFELKEYFSTLVTTLNSTLSAPVEDVRIGETKNYAIIKFKAREALMVMSQLSNLEYKGFALKLRKPKGFFNRLYQLANDRYDPYGNIITSTSEVDHTLYMGGLPQYLQEEEVRKICESFGLLRYFNLIKERNGDEYISKGYCFFEYQDPKQTDKAVEGLNQLEIGDKRLKVSRASRTETVMPRQSDAQKETLKREGRLVKEKKTASNASGSFLATYGRIADPLIQMLLNIPQSARHPGKIVQFLNMATPDDLVDDQFYQTLYDDIARECNKFGELVNILICRPDFDTGKAGPEVGKVFVKFLGVVSAKRAQHNISGKIYNKKTVIASFYPEEPFEALLAQHQS